MILGGGQENGMRAGTENTPMIAGLGAAAEIATVNLERNSENMRKTRDHLLTILKNMCSDVQWISAEPVLPNTLLVSHQHFGIIQVLIILQGLHSEIEATNRPIIEIRSDIFNRCCLSLRSFLFICANCFGVRIKIMLLKLYFIFLFSIDPEIQSNVIRFSTGKHTSSEDIENVGSIITSILTERV